MISDGQYMNFKIRRFVSYKNLCWFMSMLAHEYKRLEYEGFISKYRRMKYHGMHKRYLNAYIEYLTNKSNGVELRIEDINIPKHVIAEPCIYYAYFEGKDKSVISKSIPLLIPEMLKYGFLMTQVQEAVHGEKG